MASTVAMIQAAAVACGLVGAASLSVPALVRALKSLYDTLGDGPERDRAFEAWRDAQVLADDVEHMDREVKGGK